MMLRLVTGVVADPHLELVHLGLRCFSGVDGLVMLWVNTRALIYFWA